MIHIISEKFYHLCKFAGFEDQLRPLGVSEEVIAFIASLPKEQLRWYMPVARSNPNITVDELKKVDIGEVEEKKSPYLQEEIDKASSLDKRIASWYLVTCRKLRQWQPNKYNDFQLAIDVINKTVDVLFNIIHNLDAESAARYAAVVLPHVDFFKRIENNEVKVWLINGLISSNGDRKVVDNLQRLKDWALLAREHDGEVYSKIDVSKYSMEEAIEESDRWHDQVSSGENKTYHPTNPANVLYAPEHWNGWNIQLVDNANDLKVEGNLMNHCVGGYADEVKEGSCIIISLRDSSNIPHATVEMGPTLNADIRQEQAYVSKNSKIQCFLMSNLRM